MTTSFTRTREQIANKVLRKLGVLAAGQTAASADADLVYEAIDLRLKDMHRLGIFWRKVTTVPVTFSLTSSVATASAGAGDILFPIRITWNNGTNDDPMNIIGYKEYASIPDKTRTGNPKAAMWKGGSEFVLYPVPSAAGSCKLLYEKVADDTSAGAAVDIDVAMLRWMPDIISYDIADEYGIPEQKQLRWQKECLMAERNIKTLGQPRIDYTPVAVDDFGGASRSSIAENEYCDKGYDVPIYHY